MGLYIDRDCLISMLSISGSIFPFGEESDKFDVDYVVIEYFNGELLITCYSGGKMTYHSMIREHYEV